MKNFLNAGRGLEFDGLRTYRAQLPSACLFQVKLPPSKNNEGSSQSR